MGASGRRRKVRLELLRASGERIAIMSKGDQGEAMSFLTDGAMGALSYDGFPAALAWSSRG